MVPRDSSLPRYDRDDHGGSAAAADKDLHMGEPGFLHKLVRRHRLEGVFLFITSRCNSKCRTCFYHERLNGRDDLTFQEMKRISETAPRFDKLWLSGGEPFLREDLAEIIKLFHDNNGVKVVNLPTNGILGERIERETERILELCPGLTVHLNFSLDGLGKTHDGNRGVPGNFAKTIRTMERIRGKYRGNPRLLQNVATVITPEAYDELIDLGAYLIKKDLVATHFYEVVRGNPRDASTKRLAPGALGALRKNSLPLINAQAERLFSEFSGAKKWFATMFFKGFIKFVNDIQDENVQGPHPWGMSCTAGKTTLVIDANGDFRSCEMRDPVGNVREYGCDISAVMSGDAMRGEIANVGGGYRANCWCTHGCWVMSSIKFSPRAILFRIPAAYRRFKKQCGNECAVPFVDADKIDGVKPVKRPGRTKTGGR